MRLRIDEFRKDFGISQRRLAEMIGKSFRTVQKWENGNTFPPADDLCALCEFFSTDPNTPSLTIPKTSSIIPWPGGFAIAA